MNKGYKAWGVLKCVLRNRGLRINAKNCLYEGVIVPTALYGAEAWDIRGAERKKVNVFQMKCLRSLVGVPRLDRVRIIIIIILRVFPHEALQRRFNREFQFYHKGLSTPITT